MAKCHDKKLWMDAAHWRIQDQVWEAEFEMKTWCVLDVNFLAHRAFHALGELSYEGIATAIPFGVMTEIIQLREQFSPYSFVFCFDRGRPLRCSEDPTYKQARRDKVRTEEELAARESLKDQIQKLAKDYLPRAGFRNIWHAAGYEADDLIATACEAITKDQESRVVVVGADSDLWQLLARRVRIWNPIRKALLSENWFRKEWGLEPTQWADVKAIAGCASDGVQGAKGVGEKTAAKFLQGQLPQHHKTYETITMSNQIWNHNLKLVRLPYPGAPSFDLQEDQVTKESWREVAGELGMLSVRERAPLANRKRQESK